MKTTTSADIISLAKYILSPECKSIALLTGAGVSVASGIPDFRSPGGMYDTLRPDLITCHNEYERNLMKADPTYVVSWDIFQNNAFPYLEVRRPFILGTRNHQWKATIAHRFAELLHNQTNKLTRVYTQNIDGLDRQCDGIPSEMIVNVHGSIDQVSCEGCGQETMNYTDFCDAVSKNIKDIYNLQQQPSSSSSSTDNDAPKESSPVLCPNCNRPLMKPSTVLFGRSLPDEFWTRTQQDLPHLDLLIVAGTSLVVQPANSVVYNVPKNCRRVVINLHQVGEELGFEYYCTDDGSKQQQQQQQQQRDIFLQGTCDEIFLQLIQELDWLENIDIDLLPESSAELVLEAKEKV